MRHLNADVLGDQDEPVRRRRANQQWAGQLLSKADVKKAARRLEKKRFKTLKLARPTASAFDEDRSLWHAGPVQSTSAPTATKFAPNLEPDTVQLASDFEELAPFDSSAQDVELESFEDSTPFLQKPPRHVTTIYKPEERAALLANWDQLIPQLIEPYQQSRLRVSSLPPVPQGCAGSECLVGRRRHRVVRVFFKGAHRPVALLQ